MSAVTSCSLVRLLQGALLVAAAAAGAGYFGFGAFEIAVALLGAAALGVSGELALAPAACTTRRSRQPAPEPVSEPVAEHAWNVHDLERWFTSNRGEDPVRDSQLMRLLQRLRPLADEHGLLPPDLDGLIRQTFRGLESR